LYSKHIDNENKVLFKKAKEYIEGQETWDRMKEECDKIGYTSFYNPNKDK